LQPERRIAVHAFTSSMRHWLAQYCGPVVTTREFLWGFREIECAPVVATGPRAEQIQS
jgi:hypothetical protein